MDKTRLEPFRCSELWAAVSKVMEEERKAHQRAVESLDPSDSNLLRSQGSIKNIDFLLGQAFEKKVLGILENK